MSRTEEYHTTPAGDSSSGRRIVMTGAEPARFAVLDEDGRDITAELAERIEDVLTDAELTSRRRRMRAEAAARCGR